MATAPVGLMTIAEFEQLADPPGFRYELHHGELVKMPPPRHRHHDVQHNLLYLLFGAIGHLGRVTVEMAFRALPEYECRVADVAFVTRERWKQIAPDDNLRGAPDITIEVLSPSNTASEIFDKEQLCLENGALEFWVINPVRCQVKVSTPDGRSVTYKQGQQIPLLFGGTIAVDAIFSE